MSKTMLRFTVIAAVVILAMLIVGAFFDLEVSDALYQGEDSASARIGGFFGKLPAFVILTFCFALLFNYAVFHADTYNKVWVVVLYILYTLAMLISIMLAIYSAIEEFTPKAKYLAAELAIVLTTILLFRLTTKEMKSAELLKKWAILSIIAIAVTIMVVVIFKTVWGRQRYEDVLSQGAEYTPWYLPRGVTGGHSFPSGHTALWGTLLVLVPLFRIYGYKGGGLFAGYVFLSDLLIGLFRITGGHHFMSDIAFAAAVPAIVVLITMRIGYKADFSDKYLSPRNIFRHI